MTRQTQAPMDTSDVVLPTLGDVEQAAKRIAPFVLRTPLVYSHCLSELTGQDIYYKPESLQPGGAFKYRGATNNMQSLTEDQRRAGVVTASSGNHGIATALAASKAGVDATIIVPVNAPPVKVARIRRIGARVIEHGDHYGDCERKAWEMEKEGYYLVHPFDIPVTVAGQATIGLELDQDAPSDLADVLVPVGGGGLIAGVTLGLRFKRPNVRVTGVEPENGASLTAAMKAGGPIPIETLPTCADGLQPKFTGKISYVVCKDSPMPVILSEEELLAGTKYCYEEMRLVVEPSGAAGVAAIVSGKFKPSGTTAIIISGSNLDQKWLKKALGICAEK